MTNRVALLLGVAVLAIAPAACSSKSDDNQPQSADDLDWNTPHPIVLRQDAVLAPHSISDVTVLTPDTIEIPTTGGGDITAIKGWIGKLEPGKVIAGDRDTRAIDGSGNTTGFLRRVVQVTTLPDKIVISTTRAKLIDLIEDGDLVFDSQNPTGYLFSDLSGLISGQSVHPLGGPRPAGSPASGSGTTTSEGGGLKFGNTPDVGYGPSASFSNFSMSMNPKFDGTLKFRKWWKVPTGVQRAAARLELDPKLSLDYEAGVMVTMGVTRGWSGDGEAKISAVPIPVGGPIPITIRPEGTIGCRFSVTGSVTAEGTLKGEGSVAVGFLWDGNNLTNTSSPPQFNVDNIVKKIDAHSQFQIECGVSVGVKVLAFDGVGLEGKIGEYCALTGEVCILPDASVKFHAWETHGPRIDFSGLIEVPILGAELLNYGLLAFDFASPKRYLVGDDKTCEVEKKEEDGGVGEASPVTAAVKKTAYKSIDSCVGRRDGVYCSVLSDFAAIVCKDERISYGVQCPSSAKCTGPNGPGSTLYCEGKAVSIGTASSDGGAPQPDSCAGRGDGVYCSQLSPASAIQCKGGSIAGGQQCPSGKTCTGPNGGGTAIVCN